jgi:hypothetical protein
MAQMDLPYTRSIKITHHQDIKMTLAELEHIFRHQTTASKDYTPLDELDYWLFNGFEKVHCIVARDNIASVINVLDGYEFEGYRDKSPTFIKPDADL